MRSLLIAVAAFFMSTPPNHSNAEGGVTVAEMMEHCRRPDGHLFKTYCYTYIGAVLDLETIYPIVDASGKQKACIPPEVLARQASAVFVQWADNNPARHHLPAIIGVVESMTRAFPCHAP
jgi:hypothetical protein